MYGYKTWIGGTGRKCLRCDHTLKTTALMQNHKIRAHISHLHSFLSDTIYLILKILKNTKCQIQACRYKQYKHEKGLNDRINYSSVWSLLLFFNTLLLVDILRLVDEELGPTSTPVAPASGR